MLAVLALAAIAPAGPPPNAPPPAPLDVRVDQAVSQAVAYLWRGQQKDHWEEKVPGALPREFGGRTALCVYALLSAGESYQDARLAASIDWLCHQELKGVYARSLRVMALSSLPQQPGEETAAGKVLQEDVKWLVQAMRPDGAYDYEPIIEGDDRWDNANGQYAALALWSAAEAGVEVPAEYWKRVEQHWVNTQTGQGGWSYNSPLAHACGSMSAAGLASLYICQDAVHAEDFLHIQSDTSFPAIERGLQWLGANFSPLLNPGRGPLYYYFYLFAVERAGLAGGYKYFGEHNWYDEGAEELLRTQGDDGGWGNDSDTAFALLFLAHGRSPVLASKLRYEGMWNPRPRDLANLTRWISRTFERGVRWQVLDVSAPEPQWHDSPILYISGASVPKFTPEQIRKMRLFALKGGLILSESAGNSPAFSVAMRKVYAQMFPEWPLEKIAPSHPIYSAYVAVNNPPTLLGISNGVRLLAIHSPSDLSKVWQGRQYASQRENFELAANIYFHATDFGSLRRRSERSWPEEVQSSAPPARVIRVARLSVGGNSNPEPLAYERFCRLMRQRYGLDVQFSEPMPMSMLPPDEYPLAVMTGTGEFSLRESDRIALRAFLKAGGLLLADSAGGGEAFDRSVREQLLTLVDDAPAARLEAQSPLYHLPGMEIEKVSFRRAARQRYGEDRAPRLEAVSVNDQPAILYSREDITCGLVGYGGFNLMGYSPESSFELMRNVVVYAAEREASQGKVRVEWGHE